MFFVPVMSTAKPPKLDWAEHLEDELDRLAELMDGLVRTQKKLSGDGTSDVLNLEPLLDKKDARFVIRFVFERPHCGNLFQPMVSRRLVESSGTTSGTCTSSSPASMMR